MKTLNLLKMVDLVLSIMYANKHGLKQEKNEI